MDNDNARPALNDMRAALQACVEHYENDHQPSALTANAREGLQLLAALERKMLTPQRAVAPVIRLVR